ncbi:MAG: hypothetical protein IPG98_05480 [Burkholderiales bacterium]|nr:hypothetical protein [Burkholderiales bacterium]MBK8666370.1 hypothetical protein [Burkholderiales bacterium]
MESAQLNRFIQRALALIAIAFGVLTLFAGTRVLSGVDPGYVVFTPLLVYNVAMGFIYIVAGVLAWRRLAAGRLLAGIIFVLNAVVLAAIVYLYQSGAAVASQSVGAMSLRTVVWLLLFVGLAWLGHRYRAATRTG